MVQRIINAARERSAKDAELAAKMAPLLGGFVYESSRLSSWGSGTNRPSAEAMLAAAVAAGIRVDEFLYGEQMETRQDRLERELTELRRQVAELRPESGA